MNNDFIQEEDTELSEAIITDSMPNVIIEREEVAFEKFEGMVGMIMSMCDVDRVEAITRMISAEEIDRTDRVAVQQYFWGEGLSDSLINLLTEEFTNG